MTNLAKYQYSKLSHLKMFKKFGHYTDLDYNTCDIKPYQTLLIYNVIIDIFPEGAKVLEIHSSDSGLIERLDKESYECWRILDAKDLIGGNGKDKIFDMYNVSSAVSEVRSLSDLRFDCIFSLTGFKDFPKDENQFDQIFKVIDDSLKVGGIFIAPFDAVIKSEWVWAPPIVSFLLEKIGNSGCREISPKISTDPDLYAMSAAAYQAMWQKHTQVSYEEFGLPISYNILWRKGITNLAADQVLKDLIFPEDLLQSGLDSNLLQEFQRQYSILESRLKQQQHEIAMLKEEKQWLENQLNSWMLLAQNQKS